VAVKEENVIIRILTYNIHGGKGIDGVKDYLRIGLFLKHHNIDIALIQEMDTRIPSRKSVSDIEEIKTDHFNYFLGAPTLTTEHGWYGNALLSKFPIYSHKIIDISWPSREPRNILEAFLETPKGLLHVVNTHKGLKIAERNLQMKKLNDFLTPESNIPLVVGGDINEWQNYSRSLKTLNSTLHALSSGPTFPTTAPILRLDRLWCRPATLIENAQVLKTPESKKYSDHYPLFAEIKML
jgi:endonuclease/exonuclease/phosphatase family metal-dependent hydrolase